MRRSSPVLWSLLCGALLVATAAPAAGQQFFGEDVGPVRSAVNAASARGDSPSDPSGMEAEGYALYGPATGAPSMSGWTPALWSVVFGAFFLGNTAPGMSQHFLAGGYAPHSPALSASHEAGGNAGLMRVGTARASNGTGRASWGQTTSGSRLLDSWRPTGALGSSGLDAGGSGRQLFLALTRASPAAEHPVSVPPSVEQTDEPAGGSPLPGLVYGDEPFASELILRDLATDIDTSEGLGGGNMAAPTAVAPEPVSMLLLGTGLAGVGAVRRRRRAQA